MATLSFVGALPPVIRESPKNCIVDPIKTELLANLDSIIGLHFHEMRRLLLYLKNILTYYGPINKKINQKMQ